MTITEIIVTILLGTAAGFINTFAGGGTEEYGDDDFDYCHGAKLKTKR